MSVNKVILVGNVGKDPEVRYLNNETPVANFSLATSETYTNRNGEKVTQTEWHNIVLWRSLASVAEKYVKKGTQLYIEGSIRTRSWDDKDGNKRYTTEVVGTTMQMLGRRSDSGATAAESDSDSAMPDNSPSSSQSEPLVQDNDIADDLPF